ncbi:YbaY family lipoprotein [Streptomyces sp. NPDC049627]|uniref:YbaY family lipoprotein n=1 Tax=Streptomyces sp. NPDC049627 TaxID=3365595 RepID=UPI00378A929E
MATVSGRVLLTPDLGAFEQALLRVRVLDVTVADAPSRELAGTVQDVSYDGQDTVSVPFELAARWGPGQRVVVDAHLDRSGSGVVESGDALTVESLPVPEEPAPVTVRLRAV